MVTRFHVVDVKHPSGEDLPILLGEDRMPITAVNEYILFTRRTRITPNAIRKELYVYGYMFDWAKASGIDLMQRLLSGEGLTHDEIEARLLPHMRKNFKPGRIRKLVVNRETVDYRMSKVQAFMTRHMKAAISRLPIGDPRISHIEAKIKAMESAFDDLITDVQPKQKKKNALSTEKVHRLLDVCTPGHPENPWRPAYQERNYLIVVILLTFGFRRGELLKIYLEDCLLSRTIPEIRVIRRPDDKNDKRKHAPQVKTESRTLPCDKALAQRLQQYIRDVRSKIPGNRKSHFLFLSRAGSAMSLSRVDTIFTAIVKRHPEFEGLSPHILRHTKSTAVRQMGYERGLSKERVKEHLMYLNGWRSDQEGIYTNAAIQQEVKDLHMAYQQKLLGARQDIPF